MTVFTDTGAQAKHKQGLKIPQKNLPIFYFVKKIAGTLLKYRSLASELYRKYKNGYFISCSDRYVPELYLYIAQSSLPMTS